MFRNLFLVLVAGGDPADRVVREDSLARTVIVPVPTVATAATVAAGEDEPDLIELYGGLGADAAAAVLAAAPGAAVGYAGENGGLAGTAVLYEAPGADPAADRWHFGDTTVVAVPSADAAPEVAAELVATGATRIELCGGLGPVPAVAVRAAVDVPVTTVLFGFESIPAAARYRARFEAALSAAHS
ncbi:DUF6506 family protein [Prauserella cavernicola]|uniref:Uncharacterized protein n=1 Tax=Prauserella cavernicola TaxID=2800127 RepID=A0A934QNK4_9PSEU|nr:DUF6506 family protein [Prauserella cavernicola]MBK1783510.1 hypothetical protein [Prauserella cavernicola]